MRLTVKLIARIIGSLALVGSASAQIHDEVVLYGANASGYAVLRLDRKLTLLGATTNPSPTAALENVCPIATDGTGRRWVSDNPLSATTLMRIDNVGNLLPSAIFATCPVQVTAAADGRVFALTRIPLSSPGPMYGVSSDGSIAWANVDGPSLYTVIYPRRLCVTATGQLWMGDVTPPPGHGQFWAKALLLHIDPDSGDILEQVHPPDLSGSLATDEYVTALSGDPDGTFWAMHGPAPDGAHLEKWDGARPVQSMTVQAGFNGACWYVRVDGRGRLMIVSENTLEQGKGSRLYRYDPAAPTGIEGTFQLGGVIQGFVLGASGDDVYAVIAPPGALTTRRVERLNLVTGIKSSMTLEPTWLATCSPEGDSTGFIYANVVDRAGDNDGDGVPNGVETAASSNPFDALSRPNGPQVYISFAQSNGAPILKYVDPDGLLNPTGGLDLSSLSLVSSQHGEIFNFLLPFLTFVQVSPDQTQVTALFGALPITPGMKWQFEAKVKDKTGATGWDWQVTRPGDL